MSRPQTFRRTIELIAGLAILLTLTLAVAAACGGSTPEPSRPPTPAPIARATPTATALPPTPVPPAAAAPVVQRATAVPPAPPATPMPALPVPPMPATPAPATTPTQPAETPTAATPTQPAETPSPVPTSASARDEASTAELMRQSLAAMQMTQSYHYTIEVAMTTGMGDLELDLAISAEGDYQQPNRSDSAVTFDLGPIQLDTKIVAIGDDLYMTDPGTGMWTKTSAAGDLGVVPGQDLFYNPAYLVDPDDIDSLKDLKDLGVERIEGIDTRHISFLLANTAFTDAETLEGEMNVEVWIGVSDHLIYRIEMDGEFSLPDASSAVSGGGGMGGDLLGGDSSVEAVIVLSNFDAPVNIEPPQDFMDLTGLDLDAEITDINPEGAPPSTRAEVPVSITQLDSGWSRVDLTADGVRIDTPPNWVAVPLDEWYIQSANLPPSVVDAMLSQVEDAQAALEARLSAIELDPVSGEPLSTGFNIVVEDTGATDLQALASLAIQSLVAVYEDMEFELRNVDLPAGEGVEVTYIIDVPLAGSGSLRTGLVQYIVLRPGGMVAVTFTTPEDRLDEKTGLFEKIIDTLELYTPSQP